MSTANRIYTVTEANEPGQRGSVRHLVRASSQAQAIRHVVSEKFTADVATPDELVELCSAGVKVREATA